MRWGYVSQSEENPGHSEVRAAKPKDVTDAKVSPWYALHTRRKV